MYITFITSVLITLLIFYFPFEMLDYLVNLFDLRGVESPCSAVHRYHLKDTMIPARDNNHLMSVKNTLYTTME